MTKQKVVKLAYHRNGVSGLGFYVGIVKEGKDKLLVVRFPDADKDAGGVLCAVFDLKLLGEDVIEFAKNSWRGDVFHKTMDEAIKKHEEDAWLN